MKYLIFNTLENLEKRREELFDKILEKEKYRPNNYTYTVREGGTLLGLQITEEMKTHLTSEEIDSLKTDEDLHSENWFPLADANNV